MLLIILPNIGKDISRLLRAEEKQESLKKFLQEKSHLVLIGQNIVL